MEGPTFGLAAGVFAADIYYDEGDAAPACGGCPSDERPG